MLRTFFFFNDTATTEIYTLSLHDALPISLRDGRPVFGGSGAAALLAAAKLHGHRSPDGQPAHPQDRKSTRLNSSHGYISYAVFCLKKKKKNIYKQNNTLADIEPCRSRMYA